MVVVAEVAIGVTVLGFFVSPHITKLMEEARSFAHSKYKLHKVTVKKLEKLAEDLEYIKSFMGRATTSGFVMDQGWLNSLWQLKDAIHDTEEILDLFETRFLELEAEKNLKKHRGGASSSKKPTYISSRTLKQLNKVLKNLGDLRERAREMSRDPNAVRSSISCRSEGVGQDPVRAKEIFFGYDDEYEKLVSMLRDGHTEKKVIAIIGHGGMGKTELARQAFRDVKSGFDLLIWVPAYGKKTQYSLLAEIWKSAGGKKSVSEMNIPGLQNELKELLNSKKCLLVLDDVWGDEEATNDKERKDVLQCFTDYVSVGSRIVITTRAKICSTTLGDTSAETIVLNGIGDTQVSLLLNHTAKIDGGDSHILRQLKKQLSKFKGSPLAAIEIGDELIKKKEQVGSHKRCREILDEIENHMGSVLSAHHFTYQHLPPHLQRCFAFCSIFPNNWRFKPEMLTKMWVALGFVEEKNDVSGGTSSMEAIARGYFQSLVDRSLFEEGRSSSGEGDKQTYYVIHEQIHWMLRLASARNCISISGDSSAGAPMRRIPASVRHLSVTSGCLDQLKVYSIGLSKLRTLLVLKDDDGRDPAPSIDKSILKEFKGVRVLDLTETRIAQVPENIKKLKHVRYLGLPSTISSDLCDEVARLLFLQTLSVGDKERRKEFIAKISGIGRLRKLRESIEFHVMRGSEKEGHSVSELARMNSVGETLSIKGLDAVASKEEAEEAQLGSKYLVKILKLEWEPLKQKRQFDCTPADDDPAVAVLEGLRPHRYLHELRITRYPGERLPTSSWFSGLERLTRLYLRNCRRLQALAAVGALPCLELLNIKEMTSIERINGDCGGGAFPKLKKILLEDMPVLVAWEDMLSEEDAAREQAFPLLSEVSIIDCPNLSSLLALGCCTGPLRLTVKRCALITQKTLPDKFNDGVSTCNFER